MTYDIYIVFPPTKFQQLVALSVLRQFNWNRTKLFQFSCPVCTWKKGTIFEDGILCSVCVAVPFYPVLALESYRNRALPNTRTDYYHMFFKEIVGPCGNEMIAAQSLYDSAYRENRSGFFRANRFKSLVNKSVPLMELTDSEDEDYDVAVGGLNNIYYQEVRDV